MQLPYRFGRYILMQKIAQGGMAEIFKAKYLGESGFSKEVAIKRLLPVWSDNPQFINMLIDEAKALVHLSHPNIVQVFELGKDEKIFYISMEWVLGLDLRQLFLKVTQEEKELPLKLVLFLISQILKALDYAHCKKDTNGGELHLVHRDISPQNILVSFEGQVKVTDFGIARGSHRSVETTQAQVKGKYAYMSPEQARGERVDARTDLYAVGILLYELLEGQRLFDGVNDLATLEKVRESRLPADALQKWPAPLRAIVLKSLQKNSAHRYQTAAAFLADIQRFASQKKMGADSESLAAYLKEIFPEGFKGEATVQEELNPETLAKNVARQSQTYWISRGALLSVALLVGSGVGWKFWRPVAGGKVAKAQAAQPSLSLPSLKGSVTIDAKPKPAQGVLKIGNVEKNFTTPFQLAGLDLSKTKEGFVKIKGENGKEVTEKFVLDEASPDWLKTFYFEKEKPGLLKVAAKPWGEVTIPGVIAAKETPVSGLNLEEGKYRLRVHYPPSDLWMEKEIQVASGSQVVCQADFGSNPTLICK